MNSPFITVFALLWFSFGLESFAQTTSFDFLSLSLTNLTLLGDAHLKNGTVSLSRELPVPTTSAGRALYSNAVRFLDPLTRSCISFDTHFTFSVTNVGSGPVPVSIGSGLAFIIVPDDQTLGAAGGYLGVMSSPDETQVSKEGNSNTIAVEFDTFLDVEFHDPNANHVGLDINNMTSVVVADLGDINIDLKSSDLITAWIQYDNSKQLFMVYLSYTNQRPASPLLSVKLDMSRYLNEFMYIGFSASTGGSTELHNIMEWSFASTGSSPPPAFPQRKGPISRTPTGAPFFPPIVTDNRSPGPSSASAMGRKGGCRGHGCINGETLIGIVTGGAFMVAVFGAIVCVLCHKHRRLKESDTYDCDMFKLPKKFTYRELSIATKGFHSARVVGHGAYGTVYKGILPDTGEVVAVKKSTCNEQGKSEFMAELTIIGSLRHRNLVQLQGWCQDKGEILLVYDFMQNSSLDKALFNESGETVLSWENRCKIVTGVASALAYLHEEWEKQVVHRDVKASNIMLDAEFNARLGDFGLARLIEHNKSPDATLTAGTMGYLAPEYLVSGKASVKTDVFSFGAVVLEVSCGRRPIEKSLEPSENNLVDWVWSLHRDGRLLDAADSRLNGKFREDEMRRMLLVGLLCSHPDPAHRPTMRQVLQIITAEAQLPHVPRHKPSLSLPSTLFLNLQDVVSDCSQSQVSSTSTSFKDQPLIPYNHKQ